MIKVTPSSAKCKQQVQTEVLWWKRDDLGIQTLKNCCYQKAGTAHGALMLQSTLVFWSNEEMGIIPAKEKIQILAMLIGLSGLWHCPHQQAQFL